MGDWTGWISSTVWAHEPARDWTATIGFTLYLFKPRSGIDSLHIQYLEVHSSGLFNYCMRNTWRWLDSQDPTNPAIHLHDMTVSITRGRYVDNNAMSWIIFGLLILQFWFTQFSVYIVTQNVGGGQVIFHHLQGGAAAPANVHICLVNAIHSSDTPKVIAVIRQK